ncbi:gamma-secretase-activating protein isoform X1 [Seriola dumerili]|uniref:gamma-secretase-activating protein isoform X1 n=1 Tax=Seriola dumerili TaxID=41447 RepID=UPI000BBF020E|nr:gamma-secretase-activating protein isoform X1 [Seriola dumerili]
MLKLKQKFDLHRDVESDIHRKEASVCRVKEYSGAVDTRILNIERDGGILYSWKGATATTRIGKYDSNTKQNKLLYSFDKQVCVSSCSLNKEETLLAVSLAQNTRGEERLRPISKCLTLLIEIHPINNTKVLKAVDCRVKVQFLHQETDRRSVLESHLLLLTEDGYVDLYHVLLTKHEGYRVVMANPERLPKTVERIAEDLSWVQWDGHTQRLYCLTHKDKFLLRCVQFYPSHNCETVMELPLELPANPFHTVKFVNLGFDHYHMERPEQELIRMNVFTNRIGSMCVCYSQPRKDNQELLYTVVLVHKDCSKTFRVSLGSEQSQHKAAQLHPLFIPIGYYILVYLKDYFLHCINTRQQEMPCHSLFLSGHDVDLGLQCQSANITVLHAEEESCGSLLDLASGKIHTAELSPAYLLQILRSSSRCPCNKADPQRLAALHCLLVYMGKDPSLELKIIEWLCDNVNAFESFDQIQEFILASLYRISYEKSLSLDKVLPYSSVFDKKEVPACLSAIPGVLCTTELHIESVLKGKGFWTELQWNTERTKYLDAVPNPRYRTSQIQAEWNKLRSETRPSSYMNHLEENTKKVLSMVDTWCLDKKLVPLFQEEDHQQRMLIGLTVDKLREHLNRHLPRLGKKKIDSLVVCYVAKLLELIRHLLESVWLKYKLGPRVLCLKQQGSPAEWSVFHFMFRILEATRGLCLPLPPGYHTLLAVLAVRCLPHQTFLQYIDHGFLQLTETFLSRLMTDLDNSEANERLKFSILKRLPEPMEQRIYHMWDHPVSSASISRDYVRTLLEKHSNTKGFAFTSRDKPGFRPEFLPLTYLAKILSDIEEQALNPFEETENVDARFVEETALKQTLILLGFDTK